MQQTSAKVFPDIATGNAEAATKKKSNFKGWHQNLAKQLL